MKLIHIIAQLIFLLLLLTPALRAEDSSTIESPFEYRVRFSDTMKFDGYKLNGNIVDSFEFEAIVHWTEYTKLHGRIKLDNWTDLGGGVVFGSVTDQRYGMSNSQVIDKAFITTRILDEIGVIDAPFYEIQTGLGAGGLENEEWSRFNFENYRLGGVDGVVIQNDIALYKSLYLKTAFNPAFGSTIPAWSGINASLVNYPDILAALSWRSENWWTEFYYDSYANTDAALKGTALSLLGIGTYWTREFGRGFSFRAIERLEYGFSYKESSDDHLRYMFAAGLQAPLLKGLETNLSFNGFFVDRTEMNIGWDAELMVTETIGLFTALGGIKLGTEDPAFVYEAGVSGHYNYLSLYFGYSDHSGGNEGWFTGAFDSTRESEGGLFLRLDINY